jgi:hypothetical protein
VPADYRYLPRLSARRVHGSLYLVAARTVQGMARVGSGQAPAWPLVSDRSVRRGSGVKRDFACTLAGTFPPVLVALRAQSRLMLEGRTRTLSGPSLDLNQATALPPSGRREDLCSGSCWRGVPAAGLRPDRPGFPTGGVHQEARNIRNMPLPLSPDERRAHTSISTWPVRLGICGW